MPSRLFALCLAAVVLISPITMHLFLPVIPVVKEEFQLSEAMAQLAFTGGLLAMGLSTIVYGALSDRFGRRPVLLCGLTLFLAGCSISSLSTSFAMLMTGRIVQGIGAGCATTLVRTIARDAYGQAKLTKAIAYLTMFYTLGPMVSPLIGGVLIDNYGWRATFVFAIAVGGVIAIGAMAQLHETHSGTRAPHDLKAMLRNSVAPLGNMRFAAYVLQTGFSSGVFFTLSAASAVIMKETFGRPATEYGLYFLVFPLGFLVGNLISSRLSARIAGDMMVLAGSVLLIATVVVQSGLLLAGYVTPLALFAPGFLITLAQGIAMPSAQAGAIALVQGSIGTAAALGVFAQMFVGALTSQIYGVVAGPTVEPLVAVCMGAALLCLLCGLVPFTNVLGGQGRAPQK